MTGHDHLKGAVELARAGWPVFPCIEKGPRTKAPALKGWQDTATTNPATVGRWWSVMGKPARLIGLALPPGVFVVDIDAPKDADAATRSARIADALEWLTLHSGGRRPDTLTVRTGTGGLHLYYRLPEGEQVAQSVKTAHPAIDTRVGGKGYVIAPPSAYVTPDGETRTYSTIRGSLMDGPQGLAYAPKTLIDALNATPAKDTPARPQETHTEASRPLLARPAPVAGGETLEARRYRAAALAALKAEADTLAATAQGERNTALNRAALKLGHHGARPEALAKAEAWEALEAACAANGLLADDGAHAFEATFKSGWSAGLEDPYGLTERADTHAEADAWTQAKYLEAKETRPTGTPGEAQGTQAPSSITPKGGAESAPPSTVAGTDATPAPATLAELANLLDWAEEWNRETTVEWLAAPILPRAALVDLYSPPKTGKSLLALEIAAALATGRQILGYTPTQPETVLYMDYENHPNRDTVARLQAMGYHASDLARLHIASFPRLAPYDTANGAKQLIGLAQQLSPALIVIDTLGRVIAGDENDAATWQAFYRLALAPLKSLGITVLRLDHAGKDERKGARGSSAKPTDSDLVWTLRADAENKNRLTLECKAQRFPVDEERLNLKRETDPLRHVWNSPGQALEEKRREAIRIWEQAGYTPATISNRKAKEALRDAGMKAKDAIVQEWVKRWKQVPVPLTLRALS